MVLNILASAAPGTMHYHYMYYQIMSNDLPIISVFFGKAINRGEGVVQLEALANHVVLFGVLFFHVRIFPAWRTDLKLCSRVQ